MNTPAKPKRGSLRLGSEKPLSGSSVMALTSKPHLEALGVIVSKWPHVEEAAILFFNDLLGSPNGPAREIFRSLPSERARLETMRGVLQWHHSNREKGGEYDSVLNRFEKLNVRRNRYVHGLWSTHETGRVFLAPAVVDAHPAISSEEVLVEELHGLIDDMTRLASDCYGIFFRGRFPEPAPAGDADT